MEFGVFIPTANTGWIMSATSPEYAPTSRTLTGYRTTAGTLITVQL